MGLIARNAIAHLYPPIRRERHNLTPPYRLPDMPKVLVSRYFTRFVTPKDTREIAIAVRRFLRSDKSGSTGTGKHLR